MIEHSKILTEENKRNLLIRLISYSYFLKPLKSLTIPFGELILSWGEIAHEILLEQYLIPDNLFKPGVFQKLKTQLCQQLADISASSLATILHLYRLEKKLKGETSEIRYHYFMNHFLCTPDFLKNFFDQCPKIADRVVSQILLWINFVKELLISLESDMSDIQDLFNEGKVMGQITDIFPALSDPHRGNRRVVKLIFEDKFQIIYKPKNLMIDDAFMKLISFLNHLGLNPPLKGYKFINKKHYGWVEYIEASPCLTIDQVRSFYERSGMNICLMYFLESSDCHYENIIANGEFPILIDIETLFNPVIDEWPHSILNSGYLPYYIGDYISSALTAPEEQEDSSSLTWIEINTDRIQIVFGKKIRYAKSHRAKLNDTLVNPIDYLEEITCGFQKLYQLINKNFESLFPYIENLMAHPVRVILRNTRFYGLILKHLKDPRVLNNNEAEEKIFASLNNYSWIKNLEHLNIIVQVEKSALKIGDIPFFSNEPKSTDLCLENQIVLKNFFNESAFDRMVKKMNNWDEKNLLLQTHYINWSLYPEKTHYYQNEIENKAFLIDSEPSFQLLTTQKILKTCCLIAQKIIKASIKSSDENFNWISIYPDFKNEKYRFSTISNNLYNGLSGIALYFSALQHVLEENSQFNEIRIQCREYAFKLLQQILRDVEENKYISSKTFSTGVMEGLGGIIYAFSLSAYFLNESIWLEKALFLTSLISSEMIQKCSSNDLFSGNAGLILVFLSLYYKTGEKKVLKKANECGEALMKAAIFQKEGITWPTLHAKCLTGLSHGNAGISYALIRLGIALEKKEFFLVGKEAIYYEQNFFCKLTNNWADLRDNENQYCRYNLCHGAPGIGLARLYSCSYSYNSTYLEDHVEYAIQATLSHLHGKVDHICCGTFGRLAFLWNAGVKLNRELLKNIVFEETKRILQRYYKDNSFSLYERIFQEIENPGFMQGLSGIGYFLLHLAAKESLPEVVMLD